MIGCCSKNNEINILQITKKINKVMLQNARKDAEKRRRLRLCVPSRMLKNDTQKGCLKKDA